MLPLASWVTRGCVVVLSERQCLPLISGCPKSLRPAEALQREQDFLSQALETDVGTKPGLI